jgi:uncharacterized protein YodC (DUF2158 family)
MNIGDVVRLKCGGVEMVITYIHGYDGLATCSWHIDGSPVYEDYPIEALVIVVDRPES